MPAEAGVNSYVSRTDADAYFADRLGAEVWTSATSTQKDQALVTATRRIDMQRLVGTKVSPDQPLAFPRYYRGVATTRYVNGEWVMGAPQEVLDATCEEALALLEQSQGDKARAARMRSGVTSYRVGDASESYDSSLTQAEVRGGTRLLSPEARRLMAPWIETAVWLV